MLQNWISDYQLILGSNSPRRAQLLTEMGLTFTKKGIDVDEIFDDQMNVNEVAQYLSKLKSDGYPEALNENEWLITSDSVVIVEGFIYGKPKDPQEALDFLMKMSGGKHSVMTGVTLRSTLHTYSFSDNSIVYCTNYNADEAAYYIDNYKPFDKAGAYGIQEWFGHCLIQKIEGSFTNIMGLPTQALYDAFSHFRSMHNHSPR